MTELQEDELLHYGTPRKSGRYPWGSGENPHQHNKSFLSVADDLKKQGLTESQIAEGMGLTGSTQLRAWRAAAKNAVRAEEIAQANRLKARGNSNVAIGKIMGLNESSVRDRLAPAAKDKEDILTATTDMLRDNVKNRGPIDIGKGSELHLAGVSKERLATAVSILEEEGYAIRYIKVQQLGTGEFTTVKVLAPEEISSRDLYLDPTQIKMLNDFTEDSGRTYLGLHEPLSINSDRVGVRYAEDGGADFDGTIMVRPGVDDVDLGGSKYAQVRIAVDGTHYIKGMAVYSNDLPAGTDLLFNTNKSDTGNKLDSLKAMKRNADGTIDADNPFGSSIKRQLVDIGPDGKERVTSSMNLVNEEGDWDKWSVNLSSQMLSKQTPALAKQQLDLTLKTRQDDLAEINSLTNPAVKKKLLQSFADGADSSSVHLQAAGLPRQRTQVILPINSLKDTEIYAPQFRNGEQVVLVRYPHGGKFEIPSLTVNNRNSEAGSIMKQARDAVGINSKVAERMSGADFDGDTVLVIPNNRGSVQSESPLAALKGFDPQRDYKAYDGMKTIDGGVWNAAKRKVEFAEGKSPSGQTKQQQMGDVSNLITDMTIKGANHGEIARAVKHSMVVIDAEKHSLDYKQSSKDNKINELKARYQGGADRGADTLVSKASSEIRVDERVPRKASDGGPVDLKTGKLMFTPTGESYVNKKGKVVNKTTKSTKMAEAADARDLISVPGTPIERIYATHANKLKALANQARKQYYATPSIKVDKSAKETYSPQVASLKVKLNEAQKNAPRERQAQLLANKIVTLKKQANPSMDYPTQKKIGGQALEEARIRTGASKSRINITPTEWQAIQSGAISNNFLNNILDNTDLDVVKKYATPRAKAGMSTSKLARAKSMIASGYTQSEIADALGISTSTLSSALHP